MLFYAILGTSPKVAVGPVAMDSLLVAAGIATIATTGTENIVAIAVLLAFMVGLIQFLLGVFTILYQVPVWLGVAHQVGAFILLSSMIFTLHRFTK